MEYILNYFSICRKYYTPCSLEGAWHVRMVIRVGAHVCVVFKYVNTNKKHKSKYDLIIKKVAHHITYLIHLIFRYYLLIRSKFGYVWVNIISFITSHMYNSIDLFIQNQILNESNYMDQYKFNSNLIIFNPNIWKTCICTIWWILSNFVIHNDITLSQFSMWRYCDFHVAINH